LLQRVHQRLLTRTPQTWLLLLLQRLLMQRMMGGVLSQVWVRRLHLKQVSQVPRPQGWLAGYHLPPCAAAAAAAGTGCAAGRQAVGALECAAQWLLVPNPSSSWLHAD
jgi:hypothetical protein